MYNNIPLSDSSIFIVGSPRSGTTLLQAFLSTQSPIYSFRETHFFTKIKPELIIDVTGHIEEMCLTNVYELLHSILDLQFTEEERSSISLSARDHKLTPRMLFEIIIRKLIAEQHGIVANTAIWLEKTPDHALHLGEIYEWYPSARVIHIVRHPIPVIYSMNNNFKFLVEKSVRELAKRWLMTIETVDSYSERYNIFTVRYEDLVADVNKVVRGICDYLKIDFDPGALSQYAKKAKIITSSSETWKNDVQKPIIVNSNLVAMKKCSLSSKMLIYVITRSKSMKYGYFSNMPLVNIAYSLWTTAAPARLRTGINNMLKGN